MCSVSEKKRDSNLELFRIVTMLLIVAHHYVYHSGLLTIALDDFFSARSMFVMAMGSFGKIGINCFVLITGYFMCTKQITFRKFLKLFLPFYFYKVLFFAVFALSGYVTISSKFIIESLLPFTEVGIRFLDCYFIFFLFIPFLNILISHLNKKDFQLLLALCLFVFSILPTLSINVYYSHVSWYMVVYLIAAYLRLYLSSIDGHRLFIRLGLTISVILCFLSVGGGACMAKFLHKGGVYFFVVDCPKPLAVITSVFAFLFFKNVQISYSRIINTVAASSFGVLLIHDNCRTLKDWLWNVLLDAKSHYDGNIYLLAFVSVFGVYIVCTLIDFIRIYLIDKPLFKWIDRKIKKI